MRRSRGSLGPWSLSLDAAGGSLLALLLATEEAALGLVVGRGRAVARGLLERGELLDQPALLVAELAGDGDVEAHVEVAAAAPLQVRHALAAERDHRAGLGAGGDVDVRVAVDGGHRDLAAERRLRVGDVGLGVEVVPVALEA